jgi:hypothetical protein
MKQFLLMIFCVLTKDSRSFKKVRSELRRFKYLTRFSNINAAAIPNIETPFDMDSVEIVPVDNRRESHKYYGSAINSCPTLVLNADYKPLSHLPLSLWHWQDSVRAVFSNKAVVVSEYNVVIRSVSCEIRLPSVIALKHFHRTPKEDTPSITRRKIFIRDNFKCQVLPFFPSKFLLFVLYIFC